MTDHGRARRGALLALTWVLSSLPAVAAGQGLDLGLPDDAMLVTGAAPAAGQHIVALGPHDGRAVPQEAVNGVVQTQVWQIPGAPSVPDLTDTLRASLARQGFEILFHCADRACGGFDFRYALPVGDAPEMHVDLGDFHYIAARQEDGGATAALMVSRGADTGYVHLAIVDDQARAATILSTRGAATIPVTGAETAAMTLAERLEATGRAPLDDLSFATGASELSGDDFPSLIALAGLLEDRPDLRVALVGHTDADGALSGNIALSQARAEAVRDHLVTMLGADAGRITAEGIGFLAPRASNATPEGREANRRVEVVVLDGVPVPDRTE